MQDDSSEAARLGEILVTMLQSGATTEVLGRFALLYRNKLTTAGQPAGLGELGPVLESFSESVVGKVLSRMGGAGQPGPAVVTPAPIKPSTARAVIVKLTVNGKPTSVSIPRRMLQQCQESLGVAEAKAMIEELGQKAPADGNRSRYVQDGLGELIKRLRASPPADSAGTSRH